jgi:protoporphyrinogen oxidase
MDVVRYGLAGIYLRFFSRWEPLEDITAEAWTRRWFGPRIFELQWWPLLVSKFGEQYAREVTMAWLWARLKSRTTRLGTFVGGFQAFLDRLAEHVESMGAVVRLGQQVTSITRQQAGGPLTVATPEGSAEFDAVVSTSSPQTMLKLAHDLPDEYAGLLADLNSMGAVVLVLSLKHKLTDYYWHNLPKEAGFPFMALVEHTNYVGSEHFGGEHIVYCGDYRDPDHEYFSLSTEELKERFLPVLSRFNPDFDPDWVTGAWSWQADYAQPVPPVNHSKNIPDLRTPIPGLYFASMSQIYPWDRGTNYAVELAQRVSRLVDEDLSKALGPT